jgi:hypothetical protein
MTPKMQRLSTIILIPVTVLFLFSCASDPGAESQVKSENEIRTYERFKSEHTMSNEKDLEKAGIYYDGKFFYVVISLTNSGTDRYPEWACDKFLNSLYGYRAVDQRMVSDNEFYELALKFSLNEIIDGKYENLAIVSVKEKDIEAFLKDYKEEN